MKRQWLAQAPTWLLAIVFWEAAKGVLTDKVFHYLTGLLLPLGQEVLSQVSVTLGLLLLWSCFLSLWLYQGRKLAQADVKDANSKLMALHNHRMEQIDRFIESWHQERDRDIALPIGALSTLKNQNGQGK